ncbi:hypothetical protein ACSQ67_025226 [Phaseolus vulgaris]
MVKTDCDSCERRVRNFVSNISGGGYVSLEVDGRKIDAGEFGRVNVFREKANEVGMRNGEGLERVGWVRFLKWETTKVRKRSVEGSWRGTWGRWWE